MAEETTEATETTDAPVAESPATDATATDATVTDATVTEAPATASGRAARKVREGTVVSNKMDKTAVVAVVSRAPHARYNKMVLRTTKLQAHDETNDVNIGDKVRVMETRPMSKNKRWRIMEVLERAK